MNSCLYECQVMHARFSPRPHRFVYRIFLFAVDLDELPALPGRLKLFSVNRPNFYSFRDGDFLPIPEAVHNAPPEALASPQSQPPATLKERVIAHAARQGVDLTAGRVLLVTLPRIAGYRFNPVSFYFCYDRSGAPACAIAEVTNTFHEVKPYFLGPEAVTAQGEFHLRVPKHFYVSPYSDVDVDFDFTLRTPGHRLSVQIDDYVGADRTLTSTLSGPRRELTAGRLAWFAAKYPLLTLRVIALIHWHALRLWWKRVPWFAKAARPADQRGLYRPHASLTASPPPNLPPSQATS